MSKSVQVEVDALLRFLKSRFSVPVSAGWPQYSSQGLYVFPYAIAPENPLRQDLSHGSSEENISLPSFVVQVLLIANPESDLSLLGEAINALHEYPVFEEHPLSVRASMNLLSIEQLTQLFLARNEPLRLCASYTLQTIHQ